MFTRVNLPGTILLVLFSPLFIEVAVFAENDQHKKEKGDNGKKFSAKVFFSKEDKNWKETENYLDELCKNYSPLTVKKISIDTDEGYKKLVALEKRLGVKSTGDITFVFNDFVLTNNEERKEIQGYLESALKRILESKEIKNRRKINIRKFVEKNFSETAKTKTPVSTPGIIVHSVYKVGDEKKEIPLGWVVDAFYPIACPVCRDVQFLLAVKTDSVSVLEIKPIHPLERWGKPLDEKEEKKFLQSFVGISADSYNKNDLQLNKKIDSVSGATKTANAYQKAVRAIILKLSNEK